MNFKKIASLPKKIYQALKYANSEYEYFINAYLVDEKKLAHIGEKTILKSKVYISNPKRLYIGSNSTIQANVAIHSMGGVYIGNYVGIGMGSVIISFVHNYNYCESIPYDQTIFLKPVVIRDYAWLGWHTHINPGIEIGEGAIVSMGAVVTNDVPPLSIVMGNPASVVAYRSKKHFEECKANNRHNSHRILEVFGKYEEKLPMMMRRKFKTELKALGML